MSARRLFWNFAAAVAALIFAFGVAAVALTLVGLDPVFAFKEMANFAASVASFISIINRATPLFVSAIAVAIGFKMGLFNIGVEGQYLLAALFAAYLGAQVTLWAPLHVVFILAIAMVVGALWAGIAGALKVARGIHEVISTIMLNFMAIGLSAYFFINFFREDPAALNLFTAPIPPSGWLPSLNPVLERLGFEVPGSQNLTSFALIAILIGVFYYLLVWRTRFGYDLRASGINAFAAQTSGVDRNQMVLKTMLLSGAMAGLVGMSPLLSFQHQYVSDFPVQLGFTGIAVALVGRNHPVGIALAALLFGLMDRSALILDVRGIPREIIVIIQGTVVLAVVVAYEVVTRIVERQEVRAAARATGELDEEELAA
ncbi:MAG: ABC transporter permease [Acidimicrobiia bacterium]